MKVEVTPAIVWKLERAVDILGSKAELGRRLRYASGGRAIHHLLCGRTRTISPEQLETLDSIINDGHPRSPPKQNGLPVEEHINLWPP